METYRSSGCCCLAFKHCVALRCHALRCPALRCRALRFPVRSMSLPHPLFIFLTLYSPHFKPVPSLACMDASAFIHAHAASRRRSNRAATTQHPCNTTTHSYPSCPSRLVLFTRLLNQMRRGRRGESNAELHNY